MSLAGISTAIALVAKYVEQESQKPNPTHRPEDLAAGALRVYITYAIYLVVYLYYFAISLLVVIGVHRVSIFSLLLLLFSFIIKTRVPDRQLILSDHHNYSE